MDETKRLICAILKFLDGEIKNKRPTEELAESLEVAMQCLESAYGISLNDAPNDPPLSVSFKGGMSPPEPCPYRYQPDPDFNASTEAERCKTEGNNLVKANKLVEALESYTRAMHYDCKNAVYYCNRAAAFNKLNNHHAAVMDCKTALTLDPNYSKAYGRLGVAYACMKMHKEAIENYQKALELEPGNDAYINNMRISEESLRGNITATSRGPENVEALQEAVTSGGLQFSNLLNNPALVNMATEVLSDPNLQNLMSNLLAGSGMDALMQAGQSLAQQMEVSNPDLIENLRRQMTGQNRNTAPTGPPNNLNQDPPPPGPGGDAP